MKWQTTSAAKIEIVISAERILTEKQSRLRLKH